MFMNLDTLPADQHMYTAFVADPDQNWGDPDSVCYDEIDFVSGSNDSTTLLRAKAETEAKDLYTGQEIIAIADQSVGGWVWVNEHGKALKR